MTTTELYELKESFLQEWPLSRIKSMTLEEYTNLEKTSFCYWIEHITNAIGSIRGGSSYKFGIYRMGASSETEPANNRNNNGKYAWHNKYGATQDEVFHSLKNAILQVIHLSHENNLKPLDDIDLGNAYKWKIAFLYGDFNIVNIFKQESLLEAAQSIGYDYKNTTYSSLNKFIIDKKDPSDDYFDYTFKLWEATSLNSSVKYWLYAPGENASLWEEFYAAGIMGLGWDQLGDLNNYDSKKAIKLKLQELDNETSSKQNNTAANFEFYKEINPGDIVIVKKGRGELLGYGEVISDYYYDQARSKYKSCRKVDWKLKGNWKVDFSLVLKTLTDITRYKVDGDENEKFYEKLLRIMGNSAKSKINYKDSFSDWLTMKIPKDSGTKSSYLRAIELLSKTVGYPIFEENSYEKMDLLYEDLKTEQRIEGGKYWNAKSTSYGQKGFYSAAINKYSEFLKEYLLHKPIMKTTSFSTALNQILYGPPGTGKTYATKELAVNIVSPAFIKELDIKLTSTDKRKAITTEYDRLFNLGQIVFTTFHQSMSYEDFIEGIKPETNDGEVSYEVKKGIFRKLCIKAEEREIKSNNFEESYKLLLKDIDNSHNKSLILETLIQSKEFTIYKNSKNNIKFHANTVKAYEGVIKKEFLEHYLKTGEALDWPSYVKALGSYMQEKYKYKQSEEINENPVVLIIDEINRGNVSAIFGELITLLEEDKRIGEDEELRIKLPYSKDPNFGIPSNLYIIGTMNTADRSVEALDTALRRRFSFSEIMPNPKLLEEIQFNGFNLSEVLKTINERVEVLLDRDHTIGHSYFLKVKNGDVISLKSVFKNNIFPLLQEYFYHDYEKIALILGEGFVRVKENQSVKFAKFNDITTPDIAAQFELIDKIEDIEAAVHLLLNRNV